MRRYLALLITTILIASFVTLPVMAREEPTVVSVSVTNNKTGQVKQARIPVDNKVSVLSSNEEKILLGDVYVKISEEAEDSIELMDAETYASSTTDSSSNQNTYWKATVSITYTDDGTYCTFSKAGASWTQLRGSTTLSNRSVYWGYTLGVKSGGKTYSPTSNSVSYSTGLGALKYGGGSVIGCNSSALITLQSGLTVTLEANIEKSL